MKILITGGHPSPALAVIDRIRQRKPKWRIEFIGAKHPLTRDRAVSFEYKEITDREMKFYQLEGTKGFAPLKLLSSISKSRCLLQISSPDLVLSFGGYLSLPVSIAAKLKGITVYTHEQSLELGTANKIISFFADKTFLSWPETQTRFVRKSLLTGLPLRSAIDKTDKPDFIHDLNPNIPFIYITGGSQGAHFINQLVEKSLTKLLGDFTVIHQTGESTRYEDYPRLRRIKAELPASIKQNYILKSHFSTNHIGWILNKAQMVVSRAGMNSVSELLYLKKPAILIPLSGNINPEQKQNGKLFEKSSLGKVLTQNNLTPEKLQKNIYKLQRKIKKNKVKYQNRKEFSFANPKAADRIINEIQD